MPVIPTIQQIQYMEEHIGDSKVAAIHVSNGVGIGAAFFALVIRFIARLQTRTGLGKDDYMMLVGFLWYASYATTLSVSTRYGQGRHVILVKNAKAFALTNLMSMITYIFGMMSIKCSILLLYNRIFYTSRQFRHALIVLAFIVIAWAVACLFCSVFLCVPISAMWDTAIKGFCIDYGLAAFVTGIFNVLIDFALLGMPLPQVWRLRMSRRKKIMVSLTFSGGCVACLVSIARLFYAKEVVSTYDPSWDNVIGAMLSQVELCTAIVACCIATYRPLLEKICGKSKSSNNNNANYSWSSDIHIEHDFIVAEDSSTRSLNPGNAEDQKYELRAR